jgi:hypothetical protein
VQPNEIVCKVTELVCTEDEGVDSGDEYNSLSWIQYFKYRVQPNAVDRGHVSGSVKLKHGDNFKSVNRVK